jgi:hypothetical protein
LVVIPERDLRLPVLAFAVTCFPYTRHKTVILSEGARGTIASTAVEGPALLLFLPLFLLSPAKIAANQTIPPSVQIQSNTVSPATKDHSNMKLRLLVVPCLALALFTIGAQAQIGLYLNPSAIRISNSQKDTGPFAFLGDNTTSRMFYGVNFGGYYGFFHPAVADVSLDVRDTIVHGKDASLNTFSLGLRVAPKRTLLVFKPYAELAVGAASSKPPTSSVHRSKATVEGYVGIDYPATKFLDIRVIEVGYGTASTINSGNFGGPTAFPASKLLSFSSGLVFRIK